MGWSRKALSPDLMRLQDLQEPKHIALPPCLSFPSHKLCRIIVNHHIEVTYSWIIFQFEFQIFDYVTRVWCRGWTIWILDKHDVVLQDNMVMTHSGLSSLFPNDGAALGCTVHAGSEGWLLGKGLVLIQESFPKLIYKWFYASRVVSFFCSAQQAITRIVHHQSPCFVCANRNNSG